MRSRMEGPLDDGEPPAEVCAEASDWSASRTAAASGRQRRGDDAVVAGRRGIESGGKRAGKKSSGLEGEPIICVGSLDHADFDPRHSTHEF
ncbi:MAG: hypothetical protein ACXW2G_11790, partial [Burkholderiaceae bacterium]